MARTFSHTETMKPRLSADILMRVTEAALLAADDSSLHRRLKLERRLTGCFAPEADAGKAVLIHQRIVEVVGRDSSHR